MDGQVDSTCPAADFPKNVQPVAVASQLEESGEGWRWPRDRGQASCRLLLGVDFLGTFSLFCSLWVSF